MDNENSSATTPLLAQGSYLRDRWEIVKKIGGGGFGEIYKAKDHAHDQVLLLANYPWYFLVKQVNDPITSLEKIVMCIFTGRSILIVCSFSLIIHSVYNFKNTLSQTLVFTMNKGTL